MIKVLIVDDDPQSTESIESFVKRYEAETGLDFSVKVCNNGFDVLKMKNFADIVLLDMQMPAVDGIYIAKYIRTIDEDCIIMFITNLAQYAINGYEVGALDYIVAGSSAMNGHGEGVIWGYEMPIWCVILIVVDCAAVVGFGIWGFFVIKKALKREDEKAERPE